MRSRIARVAVLTLAALGLVATMAPPASATTIKLVVFTGNAQLSGGLGYPCTPPGTTGTNCPPAATTTVKVDGKNTTVNVSGGNHRSFVFASIACVKASATGKVATVPGKQGPALCAIGAAGNVWGWCGLSGGVGTATISNQGIPPLVPANKTTIGTAFEFVGVGGTLYITGGNQNTNIHGVVTAIPAVSTTLPPPLGPGGPSCTTKTATTFTLTGAVVYKDLTV